MTQDKMNLECPKCCKSISKTSISKVYVCDECQVYLKAIFDMGKVKFVKPDDKIIEVFNLEKELEYLKSMHRTELSSLRKHPSLLHISMILFGITLFLLGVFAGLTAYLR